MRKTHTDRWSPVARRRHDAQMTLGQALRARMDRESPPLTQEDAAGELGVRQSQVGRWLNGLSLPKSTNYPALMTFLEIDEDALALMVHRSRKRTNSERLDALEARLSQIEGALGIEGG